MEKSGHWVEQRQTYLGVWKHRERRDTGIEHGRNRKAS